MKQIRLMAIAAILLMGASAFTSQSAHFSKVKWHLKTGQTNANNQANYELASSAGGYTCGGVTTICEIMDEPDALDPTVPALTFGNPATNLSAYSATRRP